MGLVFNIVYTPGTVRYLRLFALSLLKWSDVPFRLVANACSEEEVRLLEGLCRSSPRLEFLPAPSNTVMRHGDVLTYLQTLEHSEYFCFMDSDIFATGDFVGEMAPYLGRHAGVFSGTPIWCTEQGCILPPSLPSVPGDCTRTTDGVCLGSSYFAIYDNHILTESMAATRLGLRGYRWAEIPAPFQAQLSQMGLKKARYNTGKLLNILMVARGESLVFAESKSLHHLGGFSVRTVHELPAFKVGLRSKLVQRLVSARRWLRTIAPSKRADQRPSTEAEAERNEFRAKRAAAALTAAYFGRLLELLFEGKPLPAIPQLDTPEVGERLKSATEDIISLHEQFGPRLA